MIQINLLKKEVNNKAAFALLAGVFLGSLALMIGGCFAIYSSKSSQLGGFASEKQSLDGQLAKLQKTTKEVEGLEDKNKVLKVKLITIANLKANKHGPVRVLDDLNLAVPERAWLGDVVESAGVIEIEGTALDDQTVSLFMVDLEKSPYFEEVDLHESREAEKDNVLLREFSLRANVVSSLKAEKSKDEVSAPGDEMPKDIK